MQMLNSTHTLASPTPTTLERYLLEFESSMSVSFISEYSRKSSEKPSFRINERSLVPYVLSLFGLPSVYSP